MRPGALETPEGTYLANPTAITAWPGLADLLLTVGGFGSLAAALASLASLSFASDGPRATSGNRSGGWRSWASLPS